MKQNKYQLGLASVTFREHTPEEILKAAKQANLSCIEWGSDIHAPCHDENTLYKIADLQKKYGIYCSSYGTYFRLGETPIEELIDYISAAKILGTRILRLWCGQKSGANMTQEQRNELLSTCRKAAAIAQENDVLLCMECHGMTITENPDDSVWLMKSVNSPNFKMYWQPFQWQSAQQNIENAKKIAPYTENIHVFNWKGSEKLPLENAIKEWQSYLSNFSLSHTLLLEFMPNGSIKELRTETAALKNIIGENI